MDLVFFEERSSEMTLVDVLFKPITSLVNPFKILSNCDLLSRVYSFVVFNKLLDYLLENSFFIDHISDGRVLLLRFFLFLLFFFTLFRLYFGREALHNFFDHSDLMGFFRQPILLVFASIDPKC